MSLNPRILFLISVDQVKSSRNELNSCLKNCIIGTVDNLICRHLFVISLFLR